LTRISTGHYLLKSYELSTLSKERIRAPRVETHIMQLWDFPLKCH